MLDVLNMGVVLNMGLPTMRFPGLFLQVLLGKKGLDDGNNLDDERDLGQESQFEERSSDDDDGKDYDGDGFSFGEKDEGDQDLQLLLDGLLFLATAFLSCKGSNIE